MFFWPRLDLPRGRSWPSSSPCAWFRAMASVAWLSKPVRRRSVCFWRPEIISRVSSFWWSYIYNYIYISHIYCCWWFDWWTLFVFVGGIKNWIFGGFLMSAEWCRGLNDHSRIGFLSLHNCSNLAWCVMQGIKELQLITFNKLLT